MEALMFKPSKHILITCDQLMMVTGNRESDSRIGHYHSDRCYRSAHVFAPHQVSISTFHYHAEARRRTLKHEQHIDYTGNEVYISIIILVIRQWLLAAGGCRE